MQKRTKREIFTDLRKVIEELSLESQRQEEFLDLIDRQIHDLDK